MTYCSLAEHIFFSSIHACVCFNRKKGSITSDQNIDTMGSTNPQLRRPMSYTSLTILCSLITTSSCLSLSAPKSQFYRNISRSSFSSKPKRFPTRSLQLHSNSWDSSKIHFILRSNPIHVSIENTDSCCSDDHRRHSSSSALKALSSPGDDQPRKDKNKLKVSLAVATLAISSILLVLKSGPGSWRYYLAGGICAAISHGITTPVDVIKVSSANFSQQL